MTKPMLKNAQKNQQNNILSVTQQKNINENNTKMTKMQLDRLLRKSRSKKYMDAMHQLDAGGHTHNHSKVDEIIKAVCSEFPEVEISDILLGFVSKCNLGSPYEVHSLDLTGRIIEHYKVGQQLPGGLEKARTIAVRGGYDYIEVYVNCCRAVSSNGSVSVITT